MHSSRSERVQSVQLMRAFLALMVAGFHYAYSFANNIGEGLPVPVTDYQFGSAGMVSFFFMSGYIITFASKNDFGDPKGSYKFLVKRFARILPTYWFSTLLLAAIFLFLGRTFDMAGFWRSFALLPSWENSDQPFPQPLNYPGWTLFIEMAFYLVFGIGIAFGRKITYVLCTLLACVAALAGALFEPQSAIMFMLTRPVYLMFPAGIALAVWRANGGVFTVPWRLFIFGLAVLVYLSASYPSDGIDLGWEYLYWAGVPGALTCIAILSGPLRVPFFPFIDRMGDSGYALYLLHIPIGWIWLWGFQKIIVGQPELFFTSLLAFSVIVSWYFYHWLEVPLIKKINASMRASAKSDENLQRTGV